MKISSSFNNIDRSKTCQSFKGIPQNPKIFPDFIGKIGKTAGEYISMPEQRLFLALTALAIQPLIDLKYADEDKKTDAAIKSASKAIAGGLTGVTIRAAFMKTAEHFIGFNKQNKLNRLFFPKDAVQLREESAALADVRMKKYCQTIGTLGAIIFMIAFSNKNVDVPLTGDLQDLISGVVKDNKSWIKSLSDVSNARKEKIDNWFKEKKNSLTKIKNKIEKIGDVITENQSEGVKEEDSK